MRSSIFDIKSMMDRGFNRIEEKLALSLEAQLRHEAMKAFGEEYPKRHLAWDLMDLVPEDVYLLASKSEDDKTVVSKKGEGDFFLKDVDSEQGSNWRSTSPMLQKLSACKLVAEILVDREVIPTLLKTIATFLVGKGWVDPRADDESRIRKAIGFCNVGTKSISEKDNRRLVIALSAIKHFTGLPDREAQVKDMCLCCGAGVLALVALSLGYKLCGQLALATQLEFDMKGVCSVFVVNEKVSAILDTGEVKASLNVKQAIIQLACKLRALNLLIEMLYSSKDKAVTFTLIGQIFTDKRETKKFGLHADMLSLGTELGFSLFLHGH